MNEYVNKLKQLLRVKSPDADAEIEELIAACKGELKIAGIVTDENDPLGRQAIKLYCKAHYGYDENTEKFMKAYESLRDAMALSGDYDGGKESGDNADLGINREG